MTDRGLPIVDGAPACPFVAFEDERDERATSPDHRHRCYAEARPAPRALAHQEAYCLASSFPVCPTFQDWARREAARARAAADVPPTAAVDEEARRNPPRDWSAPPPWTGGSRPGGPGRDEAGTADPDEPPAWARSVQPGVGGPQPGVAGPAAGSAGSGLQPRPPAFPPAVPPGAAGPAATPDFLASRERSGGLAGSAADRLAGGSAGGGEPLGARPTDRPAKPMPPAFVNPPGSGRPRPDPPPVPGLDDEFSDDEDWPDEPQPPRERSRPGFALGGDRRPKVGDTRRPREDAPSWERPRRAEDYPTLKTRVGMPSLTPVRTMLIVLAVAVAAAFFLPGLLFNLVDDRNGNQPGGGGATTPPSASAGSAPSVSVAPTATPAPTQTVYIVQPGDTLSSIAAEFGISLAELIEANQETIPNPDNLAIGDELIIPTPPPDELPGGSVDDSPAPAASP